MIDDIFKVVLDLSINASFLILIVLSCVLWPRLSLHPNFEFICGLWS